METSWYYTHRGKQQGPVELPELQRLAAAGTLHPRDLVWREGMPQWTDAASVSEVFAGVPISPGPDNAAAASTPDAAPLAYFAAPIDQVAYAGFWLRFAAYLIDYVIVLVACLVLAFAIGVLVALPARAGLNLRMRRSGSSWNWPASSCSGSTGRFLKAAAPKQRWASDCWGSKSPTWPTGGSRSGGPPAGSLARSSPA